MSQGFGQEGFGQQGSMQGVMVPKPTSDIYTGMLALALLFVLIAVIFLAVVMSGYEWDYNADETKLQAAVDTVKSLSNRSFLA